MGLDPAVVAALDAIEGGATAHDLESETLDFKAQGRSIPDTLTAMAEAAACFANASGGTLVVGVANKTGGPGAILGCTLEPAATKRRIFELTDPRLVVSTEVVRRVRRELLVISVPSSPDVHAVGGRSTERIGTSCEPMSNSRIATVVAERRGYDWSAEDSGVRVSAADQLALGQVRDLLGRVDDPRRRAHAGKSDPELLRALGLVAGRANLTNAGAILLTARSSHPDLISYVHRRTPAGQLSVNEHLAAPLIPALARILDLIGARVDRTSVNLPGGQQLQLADLPEAAVREAVINGVMHRDYRRPGAVQVEHTATRLAVTSPGSFISGVTTENVLTTSSRSRNASLCAAIRALGLAETAGAGVDRMYAEMARIGHQPPTFAADHDEVRVTLLGGAPNTHLARFVAALPAEEAGDADTLLTLLTLLTRATVTAALMAPLMQKDEREVLAVLERLSTEPVAILERTRETARFTWPELRLRERVVADLGPAISYRRRTADEYDRKIIALVRETGEVNSRMVRLMFDLGAASASRVLASLVEREILVKTSEASRGPSVAYGPGPAFPRRRPPKKAES